MNSSNLKNKLRSNKGATLVFALVALIVCVMISAVVIYTSFSNVGRVKNTQSEEQNYLSVSSAVMLFKKSLEGDSVSYEEKRVSTTKVICNENWDPVIPPSEESTLDITYSEDALYEDVPLTNKILVDVLKAWVKSMIDSSSKHTLDITIADESSPPKLPKIAPVEAELVFDPENMKMTVTFGIENASLPEVDKYSTVMTMDLSKSTSDPVMYSSEKKEKIGEDYVKTITVTKKVVHTISWENCVITKKKEVNTGG